MSLKLTRYFIHLYNVLFYLYLLNVLTIFFIKVSLKNKLDNQYLLNVNVQRVIIKTTFSVHIGQKRCKELNINGSWQSGDIK